MNVYYQIEINPDEHTWHRTDTWSSREALGDTYMEKYESLFVKLVEMSDTLSSTFVCGPQTGEIFEGRGLLHEDKHLDHAKMCKLDFYRLGSFNKFEIYVSRTIGNDVYIFNDNGVKKLTIKDFEF